MKIGGKMYLADQARAARSKGYRQKLNRRAVETNMASVQNLSQSVFYTNASAGQESVTLSMQSAVNRINSDVQSRYQQLLSRYQSLTTSVPTDSTTEILA